MQGNCIILLVRLPSPPQKKTPPEFLTLRFGLRGTPLYPVGDDFGANFLFGLYSAKTFFHVFPNILSGGIVHIFCQLLSPPPPPQNCPHSPLHGNIAILDGQFLNLKDIDKLALHPTRGGHAPAYTCHVRRISPMKIEIAVNIAKCRYLLKYQRLIHGKQFEK